MVLQKDPADILKVTIRLMAVMAVLLSCQPGSADTQTPIPQWSLNVVTDCGVAYDGTDQTTKLVNCEKKAQSYFPPKPMVFPAGIGVRSRVFR